MRNSQDRIEATHVGSLPRFEKLREANKLRLEQGGQLEWFDGILRESVSEVVAKQRDCGVTIPNDGEYGKAMSGKVDYGAWWSYSFQRLGGLEIREGGLNVVPPH
jgi:5-methyltetrahydropteroyltriglutamate--homocysteine methyltransferase